MTLAVAFLVGPHRNIAVKGRFRHLERGTNVVEADRLVAVELLCKDDFGLIPVHRRTSTFTATSPGGSNPGLRAFLNEPSLKLGEGREDVKDEFA